MPTPALDRMPSDRRRLLISTAAQEFADNGFDKASLNNIIESCRMSKSSFYYVVESKQDLFNVVIRDLTAAVQQSWTLPEPEQFRADFWTTANRLWGELAAVARENPDLALLGRVFYLVVNAEATDEILDRAREWLLEVLEVGRIRGAVDTGLPIDLQLRCVYAVLEVFDRWMLANQDTYTADDIDVLTQVQLQTLRRLLAPHEA